MWGGGGGGAGGGNHLKFSGTAVPVEGSPFNKPLPLKMSRPRTFFRFQATGCKAKYGVLIKPLIRGGQRNHFGRGVGSPSPKKERMFWRGLITQHFRPLLRFQKGKSTSFEIEFNVEQLLSSAALLLLKHPPPLN